MTLCEICQICGCLRGSRARHGSMTLRFRIFGGHSRLESRLYASSLGSQASGLLSHLLVAEHEVYYPAAADVWMGVTTVLQDVVLVATGLLQSVGKERHSLESALPVDFFGQRED